MKSILSKNEYSYPLIIWSESDDHTKVYLASDKNTIKQIFEFKDFNLNTSIKNLESKLNIPNLFEKSCFGDESIIPINTFEFDENDLSWSAFEKYIIENYSKYNPNKDLSKDVNAELEHNYLADFASSIYECLYSSIILFLINQSTEIGITEILFVGDLIFDERFNKLINRDLPETINISMVNL